MSGFKITMHKIWKVSSRPASSTKKNWDKLDNWKLNFKKWEMTQEFYKTTENNNSSDLPP